MKGENFMKFVKKCLYVLSTFLIIIGLSTTITFAAGRKLVTKTVSDSFTLWSAYHYTYSFNATAGLTYNNSNNLSSVSDLSFSNVTYKASVPSLAANFIPRQTSRSVSGKTVTYVVTLTRSVYGYYTDKVNYTLTYRTSDAGTPYSLDDQNQEILVDVEVSEPYDVHIYKKLK